MINFEKRFFLFVLLEFEILTKKTHGNVLTAMKSYILWSKIVCL